MYYFAYGSNMCERRICSRVRSSHFISLGHIKKYILKFNKLSNDGSGKCNICYTGGESDKVFGVIYEMEDSERALLDHVEGLGKGYQVMNSDVITADGAVNAFLYIADLTAVNNHVLPYHWYKKLVVAGARQHDLPVEYIDYLNAMAAIDDPNKERELRELKNLPC